MFFKKSPPKKQFFWKRTGKIRRLMSFYAKTKFFCTQSFGVLHLKM